MPICGPLISVSSIIPCVHSLAKSTVFENQRVFVEGGLQLGDRAEKSSISSAGSECFALYFSLILI